jgi:acetyl esterase
MPANVPQAAVRARTESGDLRILQRADYERLIDDETWAFIAKSDRWFPPEAAGLPIERQRAIYNAMCRAFHAVRPDGVLVHDQAIDGQGGTLLLRRYRPVQGEPRATVLYYHGGGFILGDLDSHDDICAEICARTGFDVLSADYRLAPEHPHPAAFEDACAAFDWAAAMSGRPIVLCGESAGGNLAAAVVHARRAHDRAAIGQVLIYPGLGGDVTAGSYVTHAEAPLLSTNDVLFYHDVRLGARGGHDDPTNAPLTDTDFSGLPPTVIVTAQCDPLSSDGGAYRDRIVAAGGRARWQEEAGLPHSFVRARHLSARAALGFGHILVAIAALGRGEWPY